MMLSLHEENELKIVTIAPPSAEKARPILESAFFKKKLIYLKN